MNTPGTDTPDTQEPTRLVPGTPEYDAAMIARAERGRQSVTEPVQDQGQEGDQLILGKYKDYSELEKAHKELESKLGQLTAQRKSETEPTLEISPDGEAAEASETQDGNTAAEAESADASPLDFSTFTAEFTEHGALSEASFKSLEDRGIPREVVELGLYGLQAMNRDRMSAVADALGGKEAVSTLQDWARSNLEKTQLEAFNRQIASAASAEDVVFAYSALQQRHAKATGEANLVTGTPADSKSTVGFSSRQEQSAAMNDPRYQKDPAYRAAVEKRVLASNF